MSDALRVGFVGLGGICRQRHVPGLKRIPGVEIVAVANRSRASSERAAAEFGIPEICEDWRELVARPDLQAVFIGTWPYMHREVSLAALDAGKHVFCQARMAMNAAEALEMVRRARALDLVAALCPVPFGLKYDRVVARMLREGELGEIRLVQAASLAGAYADPATPMNWRKDHRLSGLNMHTLGMYVEVMHRWFGWTAEASAQTQTFAPERVDETGARVEVRIPDQILLAALAVRFAHQRLACLSRHFLVVDEVHAHDDYVLETLRTLLDAHHSAGGIALLMSATLPSRALQRLAGPGVRGQVVCRIRRRAHDGSHRPGQQCHRYRLVPQPAGAIPGVCPAPTRALLATGLQRWWSQAGPGDLLPGTQC